MSIEQGRFYFISDAFFEKIGDPNLMTNYTTTKRPHYYAIRDEKTSLIWMIPCSSRVNKYKRIIEDRKRRNKTTLGIKIVRIRGEESVLLLQSMFPVREKYIVGEYIRAGMPVVISGEKIDRKIEKDAKRVIMMFRRGMRFFPDQPDAMRIEQMMLDELS